jgi:Hemerythrin HHE cation binding domain
MTNGPPFTLSARRPADPEPDLTPLLVTHRAIRADMARLAAAVAQPAAQVAAESADEGAAESADGAGRDAVRRYGAALFTQITSHLDDEDGILWPVIAAAAGPCVDLAPLTDDHQAIGAALGRADRDLTGTRVRELRDMLDEHIADEEAHILPAMRSYLPAGAYRWCEEQSWHRAPLAALRFRVPWLARFAGPGELSTVLAAGGREAWLLLAAARHRYARLERQAFGAS